MPAGLFLASNQQPVFHSLATANASRTPNFMWWTSNNMNGFTAQLGYSTSPLRTSATNEVENNVGTTSAQRKADGTYFKLGYVNGPVDASLSSIDYKSAYIAGTPTGSGALGAGLNANADQKGTTFVVKYQATPQLRVAYGYSDEQTIANASAAAVAVSGSAASSVISQVNVGDATKATANAISAAYKMGASQFTLNWAKRSNLKLNGAEQAATGIQQVSLAWNYDLSKNTSIGIMNTVQKLDANLVNAGGLFYQGNNAYGGQFSSFRGETYKITSFALRQNF